MCSFILPKDTRKTLSHLQTCQILKKKKKSELRQVTFIFSIVCVSKTYEYIFHVLRHNFVYPNNATALCKGLLFIYLSEERDVSRTSMLKDSSQPASHVQRSKTLQKTTKNQVIQRKYKSVWYSEERILFLLYILFILVFVSFSLRCL